MSTHLRPAKDASSILARSALFSGLCLLVPVPFLDEILAARARRHMVSSLLTLHGRTPGARSLQPLWANPSSGCLPGALGLVGKLVLWPIKKLLRTIFFFLAARASALEISRTYLLGRTLDRLLVSGQFSQGDLTQESLAVRSAFEAAFQHVDRRLVSAAAGPLVSALKGVSAGTIRAVRELMARAPQEQSQPELDALPADERSSLQVLLDHFQTLLRSPEVVAFLADFDHRFDLAIAATTPMQRV